MPTTRSAKKAKREEERQAEPVSGSKRILASPKKGRKAAAAQPSPKAGSKRKAAEPEPPAAAAADSGDDGQLEQQEEGAGDRAEPEQQEAGGKAEAEPEQQEQEASGGKAEAEQGQPLPDNAVEEGKVSFMFRHKVTTPGADVDASDLDDVQRLYLLLEPHSPPGGKCRLIVLPKKKLPDTQRHERFFAFVEAVGASLSELTAGLGEHTYSTKTRGEHLQPAAQPAGEGTYVIAKGGSRNGIHLGFKLSSPCQPGEVQEMLGIHEEGSFVLSAKNPDKKGQGPPNVPSAGPEPQYSDEQREEFGGRSWIVVEDRSLLDVAGTELLLVGAKADPTEDLGDAGKLLEEAAAA